MKKQFDLTLYRLAARLSARVRWGWLVRWKCMLGVSLLATGGVAQGRQPEYPVTPDVAQPGEASAVDSTEVFCYVQEEVPVFAQGNLKHYVREMARYPAEAVEDGVVGTVCVRFVIDSLGKVGEVVVIRGVHPVLDSVAVEVVRGMPDWMPARFRGKPCRCSYTLLVPFTREMLEEQRRILKEIKEEGMMCYDVDDSQRLPGDGLKYRLWDLMEYPQEAFDRGIEGTVYVSFDIDEQGRAVNARVERGVHPLLDAEALRMVAALPVQEPVSVNGRAERVNYVFPVIFDKKKKQYDVHVVTPQMPRFPGGNVSRYVAEHYKAPAGVNTNFRMFVQFIIERDGSLSNIKVIRGFSPEADAEALRMVREMPRWEPGRDKDGTALRCSYTLLIRLRPANSIGTK